jgi:hypothetical protein
MIAKLNIFKMQPGTYEYLVSCGGQELFSGEGYPSIESAIKAGADTDGPITAMELAYSGIVGGTYTLNRLRADAAGLATHLVETVASVVD